MVNICLFLSFDVSKSVFLAVFRTKCGKNHNMVGFMIFSDIHKLYFRCLTLHGLETAIDKTITIALQLQNCFNGLQVNLFHK